MQRPTPPAKPWMLLICGGSKEPEAVAYSNIIMRVIRPMSCDIMLIKCRSQDLTIIINNGNRIGRDGFTIIITNGNRTNQMILGRNLVQ